MGRRAVRRCGRRALITLCPRDASGGADHRVEVPDSRCLVSQHLSRRIAARWFGVRICLRTRALDCRCLFARWPRAPQVAVGVFLVARPSRISTTHRGARPTCHMGPFVARLLSAALSAGWMAVPEGQSCGAGLLWPSRNNPLKQSVDAESPIRRRPHRIGIMAWRTELTALHDSLARIGLK